jgi:hypothetical protein
MVAKKGEILSQAWIKSRLMLKRQGPGNNVFLGPPKGGSKNDRFQRLSFPFAPPLMI